MNTFNFIPKVFDARYHGVTSYESMLAWHKEHENQMPIDGIVFALEHGYIDQLKKAKEQLAKSIQVLEASFTGLPYEVWTCLDNRAHFWRSRLQLINAYFNK